MNKKETNRARQVSIDAQYIKGVSLIDVDTTIAEYIVDSIIPKLEENGTALKVPLIYGNAERWNGARKEGYLRDERGRIQTPLIMFKRNSIDRNESLVNIKDVNKIFSYKKYSTTNRYDRFSIMNNAKPTYEYYNVSVPSYVTITYEVMIWTSFTEHMNEVVEAFQYATDRYWGKENSFRFKTRIDSFDTQQEVAANSERIIRTAFTMAVNAYLLPETFDDEPVVKKVFSPKRVLFGLETDLSGESFTNVSAYNEYQNVINFIATRGSQMATFINANTVKLTNVNLPLLPPELVGSFDVNNWFRVYINGEFKSYIYYSYSFNSITNEIIFNFDDLGFDLDSQDEIAITGKFQEL
jgi:hypothetical protein